MEESRINACIQFLFIPCAIGLAWVMTFERTCVYKQKYIISFLIVFLQDDITLPQQLLWLLQTN